MRAKKIADIYLVSGFILFPLTLLFRESVAGVIIGVIGLLLLGVGIILHLVPSVRFDRVRRIADAYLFSSLVLFIISYLLGTTRMGVVIGLSSIAVLLASVLFYVVGFVGWLNRRGMG
ncbi:MAG: hypothetical protein F7B59_06720 [Desulfurococcales archaeon]|nr:hypothetical protein [Desulfurococcales archaeon]